MAQATYYSYNHNYAPFQPHSAFHNDHSMDYHFRLPSDYSSELTMRKSTLNSGRTTRGITPNSEKRRRQPLSGSPTEDYSMPASQIEAGNHACNALLGPQGWSSSINGNAMTMMYINGSAMEQDVSFKGHRNLTGLGSQTNSQDISSEDTKLKYKTELCRNFENNGHCKFGNKCSFAHGKAELLNKRHINLHYKSKKCNKFFENGFCEYGSRCQYLHKEDSFSHILDSYCEKLLVWMERNPNLDMSSIMKKTHTFGSRNSFFQSLEQNGKSALTSEVKTQ